MGWSDKFKFGDTVRVTVDFEDTVCHHYDDEVELMKSSWTISADDPRVHVKRVKPSLPVETGSVIEIVGGGRALLVEDGYWQFTNGSVYPPSQVTLLFDYRIVLEG